MTTARDREFTTLRVTLEGSLLTPLSAGCSAPVTGRASPRNSFICNTIALLMNRSRRQWSIGRGLARF